LSARDDFSFRDHFPASLCIPWPAWKLKQNKICEPVSSNWQLWIPTEQFKILLHSGTKS
jgi:hypothetical protein